MFMTGEYLQKCSSQGCIQPVVKYTLYKYTIYPKCQHHFVETMQQIKILMDCGFEEQTKEISKEEAEVFYVQNS